MKETRTQYLAQVMHRCDEKDDRWHNAIVYTDAKLGVKFFRTLERAEAAIEAAIEANRPRGKTYVETQRCGMIGVDLVVDEDTQHRLEITQTKILKREVTEWEEVER